MPTTLRKRCLEPEALPVSTDVRESKRFNGMGEEMDLFSTDVRESKRFNGMGEEMDLFRHLPFLDKTRAENEIVNQECASIQEFVIGVMRSPKEEISETCSTFYASISLDNSSSNDFCSVHEGQTLVLDSDIDLCYLLEASDDELGIPSSPVLDSQDEFCQAAKETFTAEGFSETADLKWQGENWDFVDEFHNYQQFDLFEDKWDANHVQDYMNKDFINQEVLFEGAFSAGWTLETTGSM